MNDERVEEGLVRVLDAVKEDVLRERRGQGAQVGQGIVHLAHKRMMVDVWSEYDLFTTCIIIHHAPYTLITLHPEHTT